MSEEQKRLLEKQLWGVANVLRGKMHADEYKNYILGFIFYKYLSEKLENFIDKKLLIKDNLIFKDIDDNSKQGKEYIKSIKEACIEQMGFFLKPTELFSYLVKKGKGEIKGESNFIIEDLKNVLNAIEQTSTGSVSEDDFKGLFDDVDLNSTKLGSREANKNDVIVEVLSLLNVIDFDIEDPKSDLLGDAYEYLVGEFAAGSGKKGGEFYTPPQVSRLISKIVTVDKKKVKFAYDPTCGSGSLLLRLREFSDINSYYGQELNPTTFNLARMNMILHGVHFDHFTIRRGDTLTEDMFPDLKADVIVANPPFSVNWKGDTDPQLAQDDRYSQYGRLAPKSAADYAFITHMLYHLSDNGIMATVMPHGALFRSGAEGQIRKYIVEKQNYLDAVIGLPVNIFYGTGIPATILIFKKCRKDDDDILFIDASKEFEKEKNQNILNDDNIEKIFDIYKNRRDIKKYSRRVILKEIKENDYNLNIPLYVDTFEQEGLINIEKISKKLKELNDEELKYVIKISKFCNELNLPKPIGNNIFLLKEYKRGLTQKLFSQELRFKNVDGYNFAEWSNVRLEDVCNKKNSLISANTLDNNFGQFKIYGASGYLKKIDFYTEEEPYISIVKDGAGVGRILLCEPKTSVLGTLNIIKPRDNINLYFLYIILEKIYFKKYIIGGAIPHIYFKDYKKEKVLLPSLPEQQKISDFLSAIDKLIYLKENSNFD